MEKRISLSIAFLCFIYFDINAQCTTPASVPYLEDFQSIVLTNEFPVCWTASNPSVTCLTFTSGVSPVTGKHASFFNSPAGTSYFYSRSIQLSAGVAYSITVYYAVSSAGSSDWSNISLGYGPNQSNIGMVNIVSAAGTITNTSYAALTGTFSPANSGSYYVSVGATSTGGGNVPYLKWDDLQITKPCSLGQNTPTLGVSITPTGVICAPATVTISLTGADLYVPSQNIIQNVTFNSPINGVGINSLTGCSTSTVITLNVFSMPAISVSGVQSPVCPGASVNLIVAGGSMSGYTYSWVSSQGMNTVTTSFTMPVTPLVSTSYSVTKTYTNGCSREATTSVAVQPVPQITLTASPDTICAGESSYILAQGQYQYYDWYGDNNLPAGFSSATVSPAISKTYTVVGIAGFNCIDTNVIAITVLECAGMVETEKLHQINVFPNPGDGIFCMEGLSGFETTVAVCDLTGKRILYENTKSEKYSLDISKYPSGIYYLEINDNKFRKYYKLVKQ
ncbi:MAG: T9SS type A sorting domain-containing protein [Bacteroidia bacterium]|nr:T9SS type A sorting domain-containing protein [Bacteroidia bacterium]